MITQRIWLAVALVAAIAAIAARPAMAQSDPPADKAAEKPADKSADKSAEKPAEKKEAPPPEVTESAGTGETDPGYDSSLAPGLSWDLVAGGIPENSSLIEGSLGFSALPRVAFHYSLSREMSVGGMVSFDYAYWATDNAFAGSLLFQGPVRLSIHRTPAMNIGVRFDPGLGFFFKGERRSQFALGLLLNASASIGFPIENRILIGGQISMPIIYVIPTGGAVSNLSIPLLFGPVFELHVTPPLALTVDAAIGPHLNTAGGTAFGLRVLGGIAYRF